MIQVTEAQGVLFALGGAMMALDVLSGFIAACARSEVSSSKMRIGIYHKVLELVLMLATLVIEAATTAYIDLPVEIPSFELVAGYIVVMELMSILENVGKGNPDLAGSKLFGLFKNDKDAVASEKEDAQDDARD